MHDTKDCNNQNYRIIPSISLVKIVQMFLCYDLSIKMSLEGSVDEDIKQKKKFNLKIKLRTQSNADKFKDDIIGKPLECIPLTKLPTQRVILQHWRSMRNENELGMSQTRSNSDIAGKIAEETLLVWERAHVPSQRIDKVKEKVLKCINQCLQMMKFCPQYDLPEEPFSSYSKTISNIFDIACANLEKMFAASGNPNWKKDHQFYINQCKVPQVGSMIGVDSNYEAYKQRQSKRRLSEDKRRKQSGTPTATAMSMR